jgi:alkyl sulfatase BDS1-like metallo-beta-lactamase superfamily hydrolase
MPAPPSQTRYRVLGALGGVVVIVGVFFLFSRDARRSVELAAVEKIGEAAVARMGAAGGDGNDRAVDFIKTPIEARQLGENIWQATGVANTHLITTPEGNVLFDTGLSLQVPKQKRALEEAVPERPLTHVIVSHSHADHSGGVKFWVEDGSEIVAHAEFPEEQRYLEELQPYLHGRNRTLFPFIPEDPPKIGLIAYGGIEPTKLVRNGEPYRFEQGGVRFEVIATPGAEGADNIVLWLPDQKVLFSGDFFGPLFPQFPNIFTMRGEKIRKPIEYIASLDTLIALEPELVVPSHKDPIEGKEQIRAGMIKMREAVQYVHDATVAGMNAGKSVEQLMAEIELPPELALSQAHGRVSWGVKSIWEYYATWFHFDTTTELYPVHRREIYGDLVALAGVEGLVKQARGYIDAGEPVHALHLLDIALEKGNDRAALEARRDALRMLLERAEATTHNSYEMDWLGYRLRDTAERLGEDDDA